MKFIILSRHGAETMREIAYEHMSGRAHKVEEPYIVISITDVGSDLANIPATKYCQAVFRTQFHDTDLPDTYCDGVPLLPINDIQARKVWDFFKANKDSVNLCIVHCEAGISRSAGCAAALAKALGQDDQPIFKTWRPNSLVYRKVLNAAMEDIHSADNKV